MKTRPILLVVLALVTWRLWLTLVWWPAQSWLPYAPSFPYSSEILAKLGLPRWMYSWSNFDGVHYLTLAEHGYKNIGLIQAFFPVFPLLTRVVSWLDFNPVVAGLIISHISLAIAAWGLWTYLSKLWTPRKAGVTLWIWLIFPTSFFFISNYTESLFLALVAWSLVFAQRRQWWWSFILAGVASGTRVTGVLLTMGLSLEYFLYLREQGALRSAQTWIRLISLSFLGSTGLLVFQAYLWKVFADPWLFLHVQSSFGAGRESRLILLPQVFWRYLKMLENSLQTARASFSVFIEFGAAVLGLSTILGSWRKIPVGLLIFSALSFVLPTLSGTFSSLPRYLLTIPAVFMVLGFLLEKRPRWLLIWTVLSTILQVVATARFLQGYWVA